MLIRPFWLMVVLTSISLLIFFLVILSVEERRVLKSLIIIMDLFLSLFLSPSLCFHVFASLLLGSYIFRIVKSSW